MFDKIIKVMIDKNVHWSPTWATWFRPLSSYAREMKQRELTLLKNPQLKYLPAYILKDTESFFAKYEKMAPEKRNEMCRATRCCRSSCAVLPRRAARFTRAPIPIMWCPVTACTRS